MAVPPTLAQRLHRVSAKAVFQTNKHPADPSNQFAPIRSKSAGRPQQHEQQREHCPHSSVTPLSLQCCRKHTALQQPHVFKSPM